MRKKKRLPKLISSLIERHRMCRCIKRIKKNRHNSFNAEKYIQEALNLDENEAIVQINYQ